MRDGGGERGGDLDLSVGGGRTGGAGSAADEATRALAAGSVLADRYEVRSLLGAGGMGAVYRVHDRVRGKDVALKAVLPSLVANEKATERFQKEAEVSLELAHEHIVRVYDVGQDRATRLRFFTMELLDGVTLREWLKEKRRRGEEVSPAQALEVARQLLEALRYAHTKTIHRDLKPENIFLLRDQPLAIKVLDFGIAKLAGASELTAAATALGTAYYMAPEQHQDAAKVDRRADLYSVSVILYEMLTGELPVGRFKAPSEGRKDLPPAIDPVVLGGLEPKPDARPASAAALLDELKAIRALIERGAAGAAAPRRRRRPLVAAAIVLVVAGGAAGSIFAWRAGIFGGDGSTERGAPGPVAAAPATGEASRPIAADLEPPVLHVALPERHVTREPILKVRGTVSDASPTSVVVDGVRVPVADGRFQHELRLAPGENAFEVLARDDAGNVSWVARKVVLDRELPALELEKPAALTREREVRVRGRIADAHPSHALVARRRADADAEGRFEATVALAEGENAIDVYAFDRAGNVAPTVGTVRVRRDTRPPEVRLAPLPARAPDDGRVEVAGEVDEDECRVTIDGEPAPVAGRRFAKAFALESAGERRFAVLVIDAAGNEASATAGPVAYEPLPVSRLLPGERENEALNEKDGSVMVFVPAGSFLMGSAELRDSEKPAHEVHLDGYYIDKHEVTWGQYRRFCAEGGRPLPEAPSFAIGDEHPVVNVSWDDAAAYARWAGKRLPTEAEWEKAARGTDGRTYPWGSSASDPEPRANFKANEDGYEHTAPVGAFPDGASPYGAMDMAGNVDEWCADWYGDYEGGAAQRNPRGPDGPTVGRIVRGGSWDVHADWRWAVSRSSEGSGAERDSRGFRCARTP